MAEYGFYGIWIYHLDLMKGKIFVKMGLLGRFVERVVDCVGCDYLTSWPYMDILTFDHTSRPQPLSLYSDQIDQGCLYLQCILRRACYQERSKRSSTFLPPSLLLPFVAQPRYQRLSPLCLTCRVSDPSLLCHIYVTVMIKYYPGKPIHLDKDLGFYYSIARPSLYIEI